MQETITELLDIKYDVVFKHFFNDKKLVENFINDILELKEEEKITVCEFLNNRLDRVDSEKPVSYVDILAKTGSGERIIIEMQHCYDPQFSKRLLYYLSKEYTRNLEYAYYKGTKSISYGELPKVHIIAVGLR